MIRTPAATATATTAVGLASLLLAACGPTERSDRRQPMLQTPESGTYQVTGVTIDRATRAQRQISGRVVIDVEDDRYTTHFELSTLFPGGTAAATVVGTGEGEIEGGVLTGRADTQLVTGTVPGVDVGFAMVPRQVGSRLVSSSTAEFFADGSVRVEIENEPAEGEDYSPTHTVLVGYRLEAPQASSD